jgi:hypothetical protein
MRTVRRPIAARAAAILIASNNLACRFATPLIVSGFDGSTVIGVGQNAYEFLMAVPFGRAIFALMAAGLFGSLAHIWFLTIRDQRTSSTQ